MSKVKSLTIPKRSETMSSIKKIEDNVEHLQFILNMIKDDMDNMKTIIKEVETDLVEYSKILNDEFSEDSSYNKNNDNMNSLETSEIHNAMETNSTT